MAQRSPAKPASFGEALSRFVLGNDSNAALIPRDTEQHRVLLQSRLAQLARLNFGFSLLYLAFDLLLGAAGVVGARALATAHASVVLFNFALWLHVRSVARSTCDEARTD